MTADKAGCLMCGGPVEPERISRGSPPVCQGCRLELSRMPKRKREHRWRRLTARWRTSPERGRT
jgi:hypothetical protein